MKPPFTPHNLQGIKQACDMFAGCIKPGRETESLQEMFAPVVLASLQHRAPTEVYNLFAAVLHWATEYRRTEAEAKKTAYEAMQEYIAKMQEKVFDEMFSDIYRDMGSSASDAFRYTDNLDDLVGKRFTFRMNMSNSEFQKSRAKRNPPPPPPAPPPLPDWRQTLGFAPGTRPAESDIRLAYRRKAARAHPDAGGTDKDMQTVNDARDAALREIGAKP